jgi:hypothetical protein
MDVNDLWNYFKNSTTDSIKKNTPTKSIGSKTTLPWVTPQIKKLIKRSRVRSFLVGLSMTCVRLWSFNISSKFW